jgi:hypothetical protein
MTGIFLIIGFFVVAYIIDLIFGGKKNSDNSGKCSKAYEDPGQPCDCIKTQDITSIDIRQNPLGW